MEEADNNFEFNLRVLAETASGDVATDEIERKQLAATTRKILVEKVTRKQVSSRNKKATTAACQNFRTNAAAARKATRRKYFPNLTPPEMLATSSSSDHHVDDCLKNQQDIKMRKTSENSDQVSIGIDMLASETSTYMTSSALIMNRKDRVPGNNVISYHNEIHTTDMDQDDANQDPNVSSTSDDSDGIHMNSHNSDDMSQPAMEKAKQLKISELKLNCDLEIIAIESEISEIEFNIKSIRSKKEGEIAEKKREIAEKEREIADKERERNTSIDGERKKIEEMKSKIKTIKAINNHSISKVMYQYQ